MLSHEWRELEALCDQISTVRDRMAAARRSKNMGLVVGLKEELVLAQRQREMLVQHISARLGSAAADEEPPASPPPDPAPAAAKTADGHDHGHHRHSHAHHAHAGDTAPPLSASAKPTGDGSNIVGFQDD